MLKAQLPRLTLAAFILVIGLGSVMTASAGVRAETGSITAARQQPLGSTVMVTGEVTTRSGNFYSSFGDYGFGMQDQHAGIYVSLQTNLNLVPQQLVQVMGTLTDNNGLLTIVPAQPSDVTVLPGTGPVIAPRLVATGAVGSANQGLIVQVHGVITQAATVDKYRSTIYGYKLAVDDGSGPVRIYLNLQTGVTQQDVHALTVGQTVTVTGFSSEYDPSTPPPEIDPRSMNDLTFS